MRVLVTGGAGFIGSHVVQALRGAGHGVAVLDNLSSGRSGNLDPEVGLFSGSITDADQVRFAFAQVRPEAVIHLAAQKSVSYSVKNPVFDAQENIIGSLRVFEAAREYECRNIVFAGTGGALYGETDQLPTREGHPTFPESPYGVAKLAVEHYLHYYQQVHGFEAKILRMANVYGPRQDPAGEAGVVAIFCNQAVRGKGVTVFGDGCQTRDYVYVADVAQAFCQALMHRGPLNVNIATGVETNVLELIGGVEQASHQKLPITFEPARPGEIRRSCLDWGLAKQTLGWEPKTSLTEGLEATYRFFHQEGVEVAS